jgi:hypothetical protein
MSNLPAKKPSRAQRERDQAVRRIVRKLQLLSPHLDDWRFLPLLRSYARVSLLIERSYQVIRNSESLIGEDGEVRSSVDTVRRLSETQSRLAEKLGLTPATLRAFSKEKTVDLAAALADKDDDDDDEKALAN